MAWRISRVGSVKVSERSSMDVVGGEEEEEGSMTPEEEEVEVRGSETSKKME